MYSPTFKLNQKGLFSVITEAAFFSALGALGRRFESCRPDQSETGFPACFFLMENNSVGKTWAKELSGLVEKLDMDYRSGNAQVSDKQFDQLENRLKEIDPQNSYFQKKMKLLSLDNYCFSEWWADKARNETMIVQPKFDGCALGLRYQSGTLVAAFTRSGKDVTEAARTICNLPLELPENGEALSENPFKIRGDLYAPNLSRTKSQALAAGHLKKKIQLVVLNELSLKLRTLWLDLIGISFVFIR